MLAFFQWTGVTLRVSMLRRLENSLLRCEVFHGGSRHVETVWVQVVRALNGVCVV